MSEKFIRRVDQATVYYLPAARREALAAAAKKARLHTALLEIPRNMKSGELLERLGKALHFPDWYGANFDALHDCLTDPDCLPAKGIVLFVDGSANLRDSDPNGLSTLIEVFTAAAIELHRSGTPLWVLFDSETGGLSELPLA
ncbi:MAG: barstar family protein [Azonexus sp.]